jgi:hypothetical protein
VEQHQKVVGMLKLKSLIKNKVKNLTDITRKVEAIERLLIFNIRGDKKSSLFFYIIKFAQ